jgi:uncharacterized protein involved in exopolysaccharide biosynthesis
MNASDKTSAAAPDSVRQARPMRLADLVVALRRVVAHWQVIVLTMALGAMVTLGVVRARRPMFKSETVIVYSEGIGRTVTGSTESQDAVRTLGTKLKEVLLAQQTLRRLIDELGLYPEVVERAGYAEAVDQMRRRTEFKSRSLDTFAIAYEAPSRELAQNVCARMADILVEQNTKRLELESKGTTEFLVLEKKHADEELDRVERQMTEFLQAHPEFATARDGLGTEVLARRNKAEEEERKKSRPKVVGRAPRRAAAWGGGLGVDGPAVDPVLLTARAQAVSDVAAAKRDLGEKSARFTEQHPDVRAAAERLANAEAALKRAEDAITAAAKEAATSKGSPLDDPYGSPAPAPLAAAPAPAPAPSDGAEPKAAGAPGPDQDDKVVNLEMEWAKLGRAHGLAKTRQADLENKLYRAEMMRNTAESGHGMRIAVLDPAFRPSAPCNLPNRTVVALGFAVSAFLGVLFAALRGLFLDDRLFAAVEVEALSVPVLGVVPRRGGKRERVLS